MENIQGRKAIRYELSSTKMESLQHYGIQSNKM